MEKAEILKNLEYMHHHNEHHIEEMVEMANACDGQSKELILESVKLIEEGNAKLADAIKAFK